MLVCYNIGPLQLKFQNLKHCCYMLIQFDDDTYLHLLTSSPNCFYSI